MNRDPIEEKGGLNLYGFVGNKPLDKYDYLGQAAGGLTTHKTKGKCKIEIIVGCTSTPIQVTNDPCTMSIPIGCGANTKITVENPVPGYVPPSEMVRTINLNEYMDVAEKAAYEGAWKFLCKGRCNCDRVEVTTVFLNLNIFRQGALPEGSKRKFTIPCNCTAKGASKPSWWNRFISEIPFL